MDASKVRRHPIARVAAPWDPEAPPVKPGKKRKLAPSDVDPWAGLLDVPEDRNQRFFVKGLQEFREHLQAT